MLDMQMIRLSHAHLIRIAKHAFKRVFATKGSMLDPVCATLREELGHRRNAGLLHDKHLSRTLTYTWNEVKKVPF
jgi:hypothetical protein